MLKMTFFSKIKDIIIANIKIWLVKPKEKLKKYTISR